MAYLKLYDLDNNFLGNAHSNFIDEKEDENFSGIIEWPDGSRLYKLNGKIHRLDGPAYTTLEGYTSFFINDKKICSTIEEFNLYLSLLKLRGLK